MIERIRWCVAVVFDLDDTLYLERRYVHSGGRALACWLSGALGIEPQQAERELCAAISRHPFGDPFGRWLRRRRLDPERWMPQMLACYRGHTPTIQLEAGVERLLSRLARHRRLGLVTDGRFEQQRLKVEALRLHRWPLAMVLSDELGRDAWKPSVEPYQRVLELLGATAERAVYVGDNPAKDFLGARRAGMLSVRLRRRGGLHARREPACRAHAADLEATSLRSLERILLPGGLDDRSPGP